MNPLSRPVTPSLSAYAQHLLDARRTHGTLDRLPSSIAPQTDLDAYAIQDEVARALIATDGDITGWKVGAQTPQGEPFCAPLHKASLFHGHTALPDGFCRFYGVEAEIVYRFSHDLPSRSAPWARREVCAAIGSAHAAIEIFDTRFKAPFTQSRLIHLADQGNHGALIYGQGRTDWNRLHPATESVTLDLNGETVLRHVGGNSAGDPLRLLVWLANHAAQRGLPLRAGTVVTTGSMIETRFVPAGTTATVCIGDLSPITVFLP